MSRRIAVTGCGAVSALGPTAETTWQAALAGRGAIARHIFDPGENGPPPAAFPAALVPPGFEAAYEARYGRKVSAAVDRFALLGLCAAAQALEQAGLVEHAVLDKRTAVVPGHGQGGQETFERSFQRFYGERNQRVAPVTVPRAMISSAVSAVAMQFGVHGPVFSVSSACASSAHAILQGAGLVQAGLADVAVVGGSEALATPGSMAGWQAIQALASETCRPFSAGRDGMVIGEGGAVLILEDWAHATARGADILGEFLGGGMSSDAFHVTQPSLPGVSAALRDACRLARLDTDEEVLISAHGTGTPLNDRNEALAIHAVLGAAAPRQPVIATKSAHGHLIGGSAALQAVIALQALREGVAPPVLNYLGAAPECDVALVLGEARPIKARKALVNAFAFGGLNASMAFAV